MRLTGTLLTAELATMVVLASAIPASRAGSIHPLLGWMRRPSTVAVAITLAVVVWCWAAWSGPRARRPRRDDRAVADVVAVAPVPVRQPAQPLDPGSFSPRLPHPRRGAFPQAHMAPPTAAVRDGGPQRPAVPALVRAQSAAGPTALAGALVARALAAPAVAGRSLTVGVPTQRATS